jgi:hypothetical protein
MCKVCRNESRRGKIKIRKQAQTDKQHRERGKYRDDANFRLY